MPPYFIDIHIIYKITGIGNKEKKDCTVKTNAILPWGFRYK